MKSVFNTYGVKIEGNVTMINIITVMNLNTDNLLNILQFWLTCNTKIYWKILFNWRSCFHNCYLHWICIAAKFFAELEERTVDKYKVIWPGFSNANTLMVTDVNIL